MASSSSKGKEKLVEEECNHNNVDKDACYDEDDKFRDGNTRGYPPGWKFNPTDEELIRAYLTPKVNNIRDSRVLCEEIVPELDLYSPKQGQSGNPDHIFYSAKRQSREKFYFFTPRDRKYPNGRRPNRAAGTGYWKASSKDNPIISNGVIVGFKRVLVFYDGKAPNGVKTSWIMTEYRLNVDRKKSPHSPYANKKGQRMPLDAWVICEIHIGSHGRGGSKNEDDHKTNCDNTNSDEIANVPSASKTIKTHHDNSNSHETYARDMPSSSLGGSSRDIMQLGEGTTEVEVTLPPLPDCYHEENMFENIPSPSATPYTEGNMLWSTGTLSQYNSMNETYPTLDIGYSSSRFYNDNTPLVIPSTTTINWNIINTNGVDQIGVPSLWNYHSNVTDARNNLSTSATNWNVFNTYGAEQIGVPSALNDQGNAIDARNNISTSTANWNITNTYGSDQILMTSASKEHGYATDARNNLSTSTTNWNIINTQGVDQTGMPSVLNEYGYAADARNNVCTPTNNCGCNGSTHQEKNAAVNNEPPESASGWSQNSIDWDELFTTLHNDPNDHPGAQSILQNPSANDNCDLNAMVGKFSC